MTFCLCSLFCLQLEDEDRIFIFGATNNIENVNKYILRSNRFEITQTIDLPKTPEKVDVSQTRGREGEVLSSFKRLFSLRFNNSLFLGNAQHVFELNKTFFRCLKKF